MADDRTARIRELNDTFGKSCMPPGATAGKVLVTAGVNALGGEVVIAALDNVADFDAFTMDNDPYGEHDFGSFDLEGRKLFWTIDYYDAGDPDLGAEDPSDPATTMRVLTVMLAAEY
jgi:hypothetical protein